MASLAEMAAQSNQIAQQNNPNFAALNTIVQGRTIPLNGFSDFLQKTIEPARQRRHEASENLLNRQHTSSENLLNRQHMSAENEQNRRHNLDLENLRNKLAKDLEDRRHNYNKELVNLQHSNTLDLNDRNQYNTLEQFIFKHNLNRDDKEYDKAQQAELRNQQLKEHYYRIGGLANTDNKSNEELQSMIHAREQQQNNTQTLPALDSSKVLEGSSTDSTLPTQPSRLDLPTYNASGRITEEDLLQIGKRYPYLYQTEKGKDFLNRLEQAINNNPDNRAALIPFLKELQSGNIPLMAPIKEADRTPYEELKPYDEQVVSDINKSWGNFWIPSRFGSYLAKGTDVGARLLENQAMKYGYVPETQPKKNYDGFLGWWDRRSDNRERANKAKDYMEKYAPVYAHLKQYNKEPVQVSPSDQVTNQARIMIAKTVGLPSPFYVQVYRDNFGELTFVADGQMFEIARDGTVSRLEL